MGPAPALVFVTVVNSIRPLISNAMTVPIVYEAGVVATSDVVVCAPTAAVSLAPAARSSRYIAERRIRYCEIVSMSSAPGQRQGKRTRIVPVRRVTGLPDV